MGITAKITPGNLFPLCHSPAEADSLDQNFWAKRNHPSFGLTYGDDANPPGPKVLADYFDKGYASIYTSIKEAEKVHGELLISPLGNIVKTKPDGSIKHRII